MDLVFHYLIQNVIQSCNWETWNEEKKYHRIYTFWRFMTRNLSRWIRIQDAKRTGSSDLFWTIHMQISLIKVRMPYRVAIFYHIWHFCTLANTYVRNIFQLFVSNYFYWFIHMLYSTNVMGVKTLFTLKKKVYIPQKMKKKIVENMATVSYLASSVVVLTSLLPPISFSGLAKSAADRYRSLILQMIDLM